MIREADKADRISFLWLTLDWMEKYGAGLARMNKVDDERDSVDVWQEWYKNKTHAICIREREEMSPIL